MHRIATALLVSLAVMAAAAAQPPAPAAPPPRFGIPPNELQLTMSAAEVRGERYDWGVIALKADQAHAKGITGKGVTVAVLDTGGDKDHVDLKPYQSLTDFTRSGAADRQGHGCVLGSDMIYTSLSGLDTAKNVYDLASGPRIPDAIAEIKDVSAMGIYTLSANPKTGEPVRAKVQAVHRLRHTGKMFRVTTREGTVTLTPWHPIYVVTSHRGTERTIVKRRADAIREGDSILLSGVAPDVCQQQVVAGRPVDAEAAFWLGLVASDGHLMKLQKSVSFGNVDVRQGASYSASCEKLFGKVPACYVSASRSASDWRLHHAPAWEFARACGIPVGDKSTTLALPAVVKRSPRAVVMAFVAGLLEGDGCVAADCRLSTGSEGFARELSALLKTLGIYSSVATVKPSRSENPSYMVRIGADPELVAALRTKGKSPMESPKRRVSASVTAVETIDHDGDVYDLTVEGTHVYACNGHIVSNTHCAGSVASRLNDDGFVGVAPGVTLRSAKVLGDSGSGGVDGIANAVRAETRAGTDVLSLSLGGGGAENFIPPAFKEAADAGVLIFVASGNENAPQVSYPARYPGCFAIGAVDANMRLASFSNRGRDLAFVAPGVNIRSTYPGGRYATMSGTSMACPHAAGVGALWIQCHPEVAKKDRPAKFREWVRGNARDLGAAGRDDAFGLGFPDCSKLAIGAGNPDLPEPVPGEPAKAVVLTTDDLTPAARVRLGLAGYEDFSLTLSPVAPAANGPAESPDIEEPSDVGPHALKAPAEDPLRPSVISVRRSYTVGAAAPGLSVNLIEGVADGRPVEHPRFAMFGDDARITVDGKAATLAEMTDLFTAGRVESVALTRDEMRFGRVVGVAVKTLHHAVPPAAAPAAMPTHPAPADDGLGAWAWATDHWERPLPASIAVPGYVQAGRMFPGPFVVGRPLAGCPGGRCPNR